ncbi:MAG: hypothetical protein B0W54_11855 [Cellvibrio sp. 79]|nr:MAG: hypothetical protein B0W54_11855 [Cellvibrio sp. 79]
MKFSVCYAMSAVAIFSLTPLAFSSTYQTEIDLRYLEVDLASPYEDSQFHLEGTRYFEPVDTSNLPFYEAAFLRKASSFSLSLIDNDSDFGDSDRNYKRRSAEINYYIPDSLFFVGASIHQAKTDYRYYAYIPDYGNYEVNDESDWRSRWVGRLGIAPVDGLLVWSEFTEGVKVSDYWNLNAKYVKPLQNNKAIGVESTFETSSSNYWRTNLIADYYFSQSLSIGAGFSYYESDNDYSEDARSHIVRSRYFLTEKISLNLSYTDGEDANAWSVGGSIRF